MVRSGLSLVALAAAGVAAALVGVGARVHAPMSGAAPGPAQPRVQVDPASQLFVDSDGRVRIFHGTNAVYKVAPFVPILDEWDVLNSLAPADMALMASLGFNVVRLGVLWQATFPTPGQLNSTYLGIMRGLVDTLGSYGIYTIVDAHQDLISPFFCGEGFPDWAVAPSNLSRALFPFPSPVNLLGAHVSFLPNGYANYTTCDAAVSDFSEFYASIESNSAWGGFYGSPELRSGFAAHWNAVAAAFNGSTSVLAYELLNEPWAGDLYSNPALALVAGLADRENLAPLYAEAYAAVRQADPAAIVMYERVVTESLLNQSSGFSSGPGGPGADAQQAFAYHIYCLNQNTTNGDITNVTSCADYLEGAFVVAAADWKSIGGGHFMTEFGAVGGGPTSAAALTAQTTLADAMLESWSYWTWKSYEDVTTQNPVSETLFWPNGTMQTDKVAALSRTYAQAIAGVPGSISMAFNATAPTRDFLLTYTINAAARNTSTSVYLNQALHYPTGFDMLVQPAWAANASLVAPNSVRITPTAAGLAAAASVTFTLWATGV
jgi:endoglycosylceramidase